jgi:hypothetical protein
MFLFLGMKGLLVEQYETSRIREVNVDPNDWKSIMLHIGYYRIHKCDEIWMYYNEEGSINGSNINRRATQLFGHVWYGDIILVGPNEQELTLSDFKQLIKA